MKKTQFLTPTRAVLCMLVIAALAFSAFNVTKVSPIKKATVKLSGAQEVPAIATTGSGKAVLTYNTETKILTYKISWKLGDAASTATMMHFHGGEDGSPAKSSGVQIPITGFKPGNSGEYSGSTAALTAAQEDQLLHGKWYINVHSSTSPSGEIRGNINF